VPFILEDLPYMRVGWQKVANSIKQTIYVFRYHDRYEAVTNVAHGVGEHVETIKPEPKETTR
jgi:hypothetical protein